MTCQRIRTFPAVWSPMPVARSATALILQGIGGVFPARVSSHTVAGGRFHPALTASLQYGAAGAFLAAALLRVGVQPRSSLSGARL